MWFEAGSMWFRDSKESKSEGRTMNRGTYWSDKEIKTVIAIWGATDLQQQLDGAVRNKVIYEKIAQEMKRKGYERDWIQCRIT